MLDDMHETQPTSAGTNTGSGSSLGANGVPGSRSPLLPALVSRDADSVEDVYSDLYSTVSQLTTTTANDIEQQPYPLTWRSSVMLVSATIGGLLFGYDTGVISGVLVSMNPSDLRLVELYDWQKEVITSITCAGSFVGSMVAYPLADRCGRKYTLTVCSVVFAVPSILMALSVTLGMLVAGRLVVGIAVGIAAQCIPVYLSEISPARIRGTVLALNSISITLGQLVAYVMAYVLVDPVDPYNKTPAAWRYLFGLGCLPALVFVLTLDFVPESPRWLLSQLRIHDAEMALHTIYPKASANEVRYALRKLVHNLNKIRLHNDETDPLILPASAKRRSVASSRTGRSSLDALLFSSLNEPENSNALGTGLKRKRHRWEARSKRTLLVGCALMFFQQITGFNAFMYYSATIFKQAGFTNPTVPSIIVALTNFTFTLLALQLIDTVGRRMMLLMTIWIMTIGLLLCSVGFELQNLSLLIVSVIIYVGAYATGMGVVPWSSVEFLPLNRRAVGGSIISCTNWLTNSVVSMSYLSVMKRIGNKNTMLIFALFTIMNWLFVYIWYPEVKGLSLEEIGQVFENGVDVHFIYRNYY